MATATQPANESVEARIAAMDWAETPLGPPSGWPASLRTVLRLMLSSRYAMWMGWGPELTFFCNDAYRDQTLGTKYPRALGRPAKEVWAEIWEILGPRVQRVLTTGQATYDEDLLLFLARSGYIEETYHSFSYSAAPADAAGEIGGLFCVVVEETERVIGERRIALLGHFAALLSQAKTANDVFAALRECLAKDARDIPFSLTYLVEDGRRAKRILTTGFEGPHPGAPDEFDIQDATTWPFASALANGPLLVDLNPRKNWPAGPWKGAPTRALLLPIASQGESRPAGVFVAGLNPHRPADDKARGFVGLVVGQLAAGLSNANAYEAERKRAEALAEIDRSKTAFFSNVSHEFRTPLTLMLGPMDDALAAPERSLAGENLETAHRNALRLLKLVNALLDFSRIEAGRVQATYESTDLSAFTSELASVFRSAMARAGLRFVVHTTPIGAPVYVDHEMWEKIVLNLLSNALKFTFEGEIAISLRETNDRAVLSVRDTGTGIPAAELPHLFERFHRVQGAKARTHEGSGIGLALVSELVKLHGGEIQAESRLGEGTTFTVSIPTGVKHLDPGRMTTPSQARGVSGAAPYVEEALRWLPPPGGPALSEPLAPTLHALPEGAPDHRAIGRIVLADDNADMREYVARLLGAHWRVEPVPDGVAALEAVRRERPALVVSDVMMPRLDGFGVLRALREDPELRTVPVILLSARAGEEATAEGLLAGANDYLIKPFSARELIARVSAQVSIAYVRDAERRRLLHLLKQVPAAVNFLRGPDLVWEFVHPMAAKALGGRELLGKRLLDAVPEYRDQPYFQRLRHVYDTGEPFTQHEATARLVVGGRETVTFWDSVYLPVRDELGRIEGVMTFDLDVTDSVVARRRLESVTSELERSRALLTTAQQAARIGIFEWDGRSNEVYWSPEIYELLGRRPGEIEATVENWNAHTHPDDREPGWQALRAATEARSNVYQVEQRVVDAGGRTSWVRTANHLIFDDEGRVIRCVGAIVDIGELKELAERERAARLDAENASFAKDDFLAMLGHELRNPLSPIATAVQLLKLRSTHGVSREVSVIERQSQHIARLVDDLLDISRITRGKVTLGKQRVEVAELVAAAVETASPAIENGQQTLAVKVPRRGLAVDVDRMRITQVLANLLTNAAKYTPSGGRITVTGARDGGDVVISVEDTGMGISAELLPRVFDLFVQARQTLDRAQGGLGLGLAIVKNLVVMHGGAVSAHSDGPGRGSTFSVRLPGMDTTADQPAPSPEPPARRVLPREHRILVVDDNADGADMLAEVLEALGYRTAIAHDGPRALKVATEFAPHVALLDLGLPVMDGYELARRLRDQSEDVKLVAITGYGQDSDRQRTRRAGFQAHLTKPVDIAKLGNLLAELSSASLN